MPTYYLSGIMYIHGCESGARRVLIPDGTDAELAASLFVHDTRMVGHTFPDEPIAHTKTVNGTEFTLLEFPLKKRSLLRFPDESAPEMNVCIRLDEFLPRAEDDDTFVANLDDPDTIAEINISGGKLEGRSVRGKPLVRWTVDDQDDPVTIVATIVDENRKPTGEKHTLTIDGGAHVVVSHAYELFKDDGDAIDPVKKGAVYKKIAKAGDPSKFATNIPALDAPVLDPLNSTVLKVFRTLTTWTLQDPPWCCEPEMIVTPSV